MTSPNLLPLQTLVSVLSNELDSIEQDFFLVLDDIHWVLEKPVYDFLNLLLNHPPRPMRLVLIGRRDPFLSISTFRARNQLSEIRLQNLRFTIAETAAYLQQVFKTSIEDDLALAWTEKTEGWIVGLRLAALAIQHQGDIKNLLREPQAGAHYVRGYLFNEILSRQPAPIQDYLLKTSILNRFCASLCETVIRMKATPKTTTMDGWQFITRLKDETLFLIKLDFENRWFRYHHMSQQLLRHQLERERCGRPAPDRRQRCPF